MKILIAPDKFKGCLTAKQAADAIAAGARRADPAIEIDLCPMADGGEGTVSALVAATGGRLLTRRVTGPLPEMKVEATFGLLGDGKTAVVEMAAASGLALLPAADRNPMATTTFGTGQLLLAAAEAGAETIIVGIGGSATIDAGIGAAQACGLPVILRDGEPLSPTEPLTGADLEKVVLVKHGRGSPIDRVKIIVACDVVNPLFGATGAARVFGRQKGATPEQIDWFDGQLAGVAQRTGNEPLAAMPGAGAAGGLGFGLAAFFGATLEPGLPLVARIVDLPRRIAAADLCLTGEGRLDDQSLHGKTAIGVARLCKSAGVRCVALAGSAPDIGDRAGDLYDEGLSAYFAIGDGPATLEESMDRAATLLERSAENVVRLAGARAG
jgi:glycerate kinase